MKVLIIDNNVEPSSWGSVDLREYAFETAGDAATVHIRRGPCDDLPEDISAFDRVVISGSLTSCLAEGPWIDRLDQAIRDWTDRGTPLLGVCYGHQSIARALGGRRILRKAENHEHGWTRIEQNSDSLIFRGLPQTFYSFSSHFEEVAELPPGIRTLAHSEFCGIQAFQVEGKPVFGIQFHPEKRLDDTLKSIAGWKKKDPKRTVLNSNRTHELYDPTVGETLFRNFFTLGEGV